MHSSVDATTVPALVAESETCRDRAVPGGARCLAALSSIVALLLVGLLPASAGAGPLTTGVDYVDDYSPSVFENVERTGAQFMRVQVQWAAVAPQREPAHWNPEDPNDPNYEWARTDLAVTRIVEEGFTPVLMFFTAPSWAEQCTAPAGMSESACSPTASAVAAFAKAAARRYSGELPGLPRVRYWQGLNEPNLSLYFYPQFKDGKIVSAQLYRTLINTFYEAVKSVNSSNLVLIGGLGPIGVPGYTVGPMKFARLLLCMSGRRNPKPTAGNCEGGVDFDIFDIHPYTTGGPTHKGNADDVELGNLGELQELLKAADRAGRIHGQSKQTPLWITEFSWDSKPPDPGGVPMRTLDRWTAQALYLAWKAGVSHFFWLALADGARTPGEPFSQSIEAGLFFRGDSPAGERPKQMQTAFRFPFVAFPRTGGKLSYWGRTPTSEGGKVTIEVQKGAAWRTLDVTHADAHGIFSGLVPTTYGRDQHGAVRAVYGKEIALPFSMKPVRDYYQPPFG